MRTEQFLWSADAGWRPSPPPGLLGAAAQLVLVFGTAHRPNALQGFQAIRAAYPKAHIFGCSTGGEIHGAAIHNDSLSVTAVAFDSTRIAFARAPIESVGRSFEAGQGLASQLTPAGLRHVLVLSEGLAVNGSEFVDGVRSVLPEGVTASGGFAADGDRLQATHVWSVHGPEGATAIALGFYGDRLRVGVSAASGWRPFGPMRHISKSQKNVLYEIDGQPALALYKRYLGPHASDLPASGLMFPIEIRADSRDPGVLRALLGVDEQAQTITFAGNVPEGQYARFMLGQLSDIVAGAQAAARATAERLAGARPELSIVVSCNARRALLKQRIDEEVAAVSEALGAATPVAGFYSYGEICPAEGSTAPKLHNETMTITSLAEA